jgi:CHASE1-domain containing sensor protein
MDKEGFRPYIDKCRNTRSPSLEFESGSKNKIPIRYINPYGGNLNAIGLK